MANTFCLHIVTIAASLLPKLLTGEIRIKEADRLTEGTAS